MRYSAASSAVGDAQDLAARVPNAGLRMGWIYPLSEALFVTFRLYFTRVSRPLVKPRSSFRRGASRNSFSSLRTPIVYALTDQFLDQDPEHAPVGRVGGEIGIVVQSAHQLALSPVKFIALCRVVGWSLASNGARTASPGCQSRR